MILKIDLSAVISGKRAQFEFSKSRMSEISI